MQGMGMSARMDVVLINPGDRRQVYQGLGSDMAAIEPPYWAAALAASLRQRGIEVGVIDANAENIPPSETAERVRALGPLLAVVVVYGSQPSASTQNMTIAGKICGAIREKSPARVAMGGLHPSALPLRTMEEETVDFVIQGEGFSTIPGLVDQLRSGISRFAGIPGLWYRGKSAVEHGPPPTPVKDLDQAWSAAAWDLLPMGTYRAHNWHCFQDIEHRQPYGAIYTSLGCPYNCVFCCINAPFGKSGIRYRSPEKVVAEIDLLHERHGVRHLKIIDELFVLDERHYMKIVDLLVERGHDLNIWAYARVDTVHPRTLEKMKKAGINWLALGIESANPDVRDKASKRMRVKDIQQVVSTIHDAGIHVIGNYIFGLPDDTLDTMRETLDMAKELNCEFANFYCAMAYPGSRLYDMAIERGWMLPDVWHGFSQHSYEMLPLPTGSLGAAEVLKFRDDAFHEYFENPRYLDMLEGRFGPGIRDHVRSMTSVRLKRRLLGG
jgi:anaerobic magnesium-protoporphyrin IX monomethyl ester cyclase